MKYKTLTKGGSTYYRKLKILIPIKGKYEKDFLNTIFQNLESICSEQPEITYIFYHTSYCYFNSSHCCSCCFYRTIFISQIIQKSRRLHRWICH